MDVGFLPHDLVELVAADQRGRPLRLVKDLRGGRHGGDPEEARLLSAYLQDNAPHLYTSARMGPGHWLHGSGPVDKHLVLTPEVSIKDLHRDA